MNAVIIPLFIRNELTGLMDPNTGSPEGFMIANHHNQLVSIHTTHDEALLCLIELAKLHCPGDDDYHIEHWPATKPIQLYKVTR